MSQTEGARAARRVMLAAGSPERLAETLAAARRLAAGLQAELAGLFVEDANLLRLAALPFSHEVGHASGALLALESADVERSLRQQAARMRAALAALGEELQLPWSFQITRGSLARGALAARADADVLILAGRGPRWPSPPATGARLTVTTLFDASEAGCRALETAWDLVEGVTERLLLLVPDGEGADLERRRRQAGERLGAAAPRALALAAAGQGALAERVETLGSRVLVLPESFLPSDLRELERLLAVLRCPLVVVR